MGSEAILKAVGVTKTYAGVTALDRVDFELAEGEIHALAGENGAGKSTLIKALTGVIRPDSGSILRSGKQVRRPSELSDISFVPQELNLFTNLTVEENILMPFPRAALKGVGVRRGYLRDAARTALSALGVSRIDTAARVGRLNASDQQVVQIARAIACKSSILILDEPTSSLGYGETADLIRILAQLRTSGMSIVYISHRFEEIFTLADRVTVLRDGKAVGTSRVSETTEGEVLDLMAGKKLARAAVAKRRAPGGGRIVLKVDRLSGKGFSDLSFDLREGEILGLAGLIGAGRTEFALGLYGARRMTGGSVEVRGTRMAGYSIEAALKAGIVYVPEDRKRLGIFPALSVAENVSLPTIRTLCSFGMVDRRREREYVDGIIARYGIKTPETKTGIRLLSGGNQQKAIIGRLISRVPEPEIIVLDEPTKGIDVNAKAEIYELIGQVLKRGKSVIVISSEMDELFRMTNRILVMRDGRQVGVFETDKIDKDGLLASMMGIPR
jgi:ribose transport system ATP-binding protein